MDVLELPNCETRNAPTCGTLNLEKRLRRLMIGVGDRCPRITDCAESATPIIFISSQGQIVQKQVPRGRGRTVIFYGQGAKRPSAPSARA